MPRPLAGDTKYRNKRLLIIYFDLSAMPIGDQLRAYQAATKYVTSQMTTSDLMAVMTYEGGAVRIKQDFTADRAVIRNVIDVLVYGEDKDGDGVRDEPDQSRRSARATPSSTSSTPIASWRRCRRPSPCCGRSPSRRRSSTSAAGCA